MEHVIENDELSLAHITGISENFLDFDLKPAQLTAIQALLTSPTLKSASEVAGISEKTLYNWLHYDEDFQQALSRAQADVFRAFNLRLSSMATDSLEVLHALATNPNTPAGVRQRSAQALAEMFLRAQEIQALNEKVQIINQINHLYDQEF